MLPAQRTGVARLMYLLQGNPLQTERKARDKRQTEAKRPPRQYEASAAGSIRADPAQRDGDFSSM